MNEDIRAIVAQIKKLQEQTTHHDISKKALMIELRKAIILLSDLWEKESPNGRGWRDLCRQEFGTASVKTYSSALTHACFERYCFSIPVGTLPGNFFFQSRISKECRLRHSVGRGWKLDQDAVEKARSLWAKACEIAEGEIPAGLDMRKAIAFSNGEAYKPKSVLGTLQQKNQQLEAENERLKKQIENMLAQEQGDSVLLEDFRERLRKYALAIEDTCVNGTQERAAFMLLLTKGSSACRKYLQDLREINPRRKPA